MDPELGLRIPASEISRAREELVASVCALPAGHWEVPHGEGARGRLGFLILEGLLARDMTLAGRTATELLGEGDVVQPWVAYRQALTALLERAVRRTHRMSIHEALLQLSPVETRLLVLFWHLAERWGRVTPAGIALRLRLSHALLGQLVGCRRASVTTALQHVYASGALVRRGDGTWLLAGDPPDELTSIHWEAAATTA